MRLIDADELIDKYGDWYTEEGTEEGYIGTIKGIVDSMPTIETERKKGKWIRWYEEIKSGSCTDYIPHCKCSECGTDINARSSLFIKFCPYCGADMRGEA